MARFKLRFSRLPLAAWLLASSLFCPLRSIHAADPPTGDAISSGLWWLYNLQYEKSHRVFQHYSAEHPDDPEPLFYQAATDWWELAQQFDYSLPSVEARFETDYRRTVNASQALLKSATNDTEKARACLYLGGAEGLKGRLLVAKKQWVKGYFRGKEGHHYLEQALKLNPELYDAELGLGIYDYYTDLYGGLVGALSKLLVHGDRARGLVELNLAIAKGHYSPTEARVFLVEIYTFEQKTPGRALPLAEELRAMYPESPAMHLALITTLYAQQNWSRVALEADRYLQKSIQEVPYYQKEGARPALYCLGVAALFGEKNPAKCMTFMERILDMARDSNRWVTFAFLRRGEVHDLQGDREAARVDYQQVLNRQDFWGSRREAEANLKKPFTM